MEDIKAYIESGILELYVLGDISPEEKLQVEAMAAKYPEIKTELNEIEMSMELYAQSNAIEPASNLKEKILNGLFTEENTDEFRSEKIVEPETKVVSINQTRTLNFYKYAFAACLALLLLSSVILITLYNRLQQSNNQLAALQLDKQNLATTVSLKEGELDVLQDASFKFLKLQGTAKAPVSQITVAWSPVKKKVWIDMKSIKLSANDKDHQYQLWALVAGKPVDLGVFDKNPKDTSDMKEMKPIASADAFAVTLEPKGGSVNPTMSEMVVIGKF